MFSEDGEREWEQKAFWKQIRSLLKPLKSINSPTAQLYTETDGFKDRNGRNYLQFPLYFLKRKAQHFTLKSEKKKGNHFQQLKLEVLEGCRDNTRDACEFSILESAAKFYGKLILRQVTRAS